MRCPAEERYGDHLYVNVVTYPARRLFRRTMVIRCWQCNIRVEEP